ncbi:MAG: metallophosphoesterase [Loktanella sp.]|nr:metallophosphoesterase [Loktanella sp.]
MANWYTADTHFGHDNVISFWGRPFKHVGHMDFVLIENMWKVVQPEDDLWIIGDFASGPKAKDPDYLNILFGQLPGKAKHLIAGNHDLTPTLELPWNSVAHVAEVPDGAAGQSHTLCHYPMITWNGARTGSLQLFGHVHNNWQGSRNAVNVGVDQWGFMPVSFEQAAQLAISLPENKHWADVERQY